jgi:hypothetical protein
MHENVDLTVRACCCHCCLYGPCWAVRSGLPQGEGVRLFVLRRSEVLVASVQAGHMMPLTLHVLGRLSVTCARLPGRFIPRRVYEADKKASVHHLYSPFEGNVTLARNGHCDPSRRGRSSVQSGCQVLDLLASLVCRLWSAIE